MTFNLDTLPTRYLKIKKLIEYTKKYIQIENFKQKAHNLKGAQTNWDVMYDSCEGKSRTEMRDRTALLSPIICFRSFGI